MFSTLVGYLQALSNALPQETLNSTYNCYVEERVHVTLLFRLPRIMHIS